MAELWWYGKFLQADVSKQSKKIKMHNMRSFERLECVPTSKLLFI